MSFHSSILSTIGNTPLIRLNRLSQGLPGTIAVKAEYFNPLGSVKDRIGLAMIEAAEREGLIHEGSVLVEPTSGNTGLALALVAAAKGYRVILTMPESMSIERRILLSLLGAELILTPAEKGMKGAIAKAEEIRDATPGAWIPQQFQNPANPLIHYRTTGPEIWEQTEGKVDILVSAVGTGGTISGSGKFLKEQKPEIQLVAVEPELSPVITQTLEGKPLTPAPHRIQGTGAGFVPKNLNLDIVNQVLQVSNEDAINTARLLATQEGILAGISSGANVFAALKLAEKPENEGKLIVTFACSTGERYLSTPLAELARQSVTS